MPSTTYPWLTRNWMLALYERRGLRPGGCLVRLVEDVGDRHAVERREAHDLRLHEIFGVDVLGQGVRQAHGSLPSELEDIQVVGRPVAVQLEGELRLAAGDPDRGDLARGQVGHGD